MEESQDQTKWGIWSPWQPHTCICRSLKGLLRKADSNMSLQWTCTVWKRDVKNVELWAAEKVDGQMWTYLSSGCFSKLTVNCILARHAVCRENTINIWTWTCGHQIKKKKSFSEALKVVWKRYQEVADAGVRLPR